MPTWNEIIKEIDDTGVANGVDIVRRKHLACLSSRTKRPTIAFYSGFLSKKDKEGRIHPESAISDLDMNGFMAVVHNLDRKHGLDLVLHTPGGGIEAARSIVEYLYKMFGYDIRVIVPHMAMSAGTMIACAAREILLAKHSCLGPIDPQVRGLPAMGVLAEVDRAIVEIKAEPLKGVVWQQVFAKYPPAFILDCERSIAGAKNMVTGWLTANMLSGRPNPAEAAQSSVAELMNYQGTAEHGEHFLIDKCAQIGLNVRSIEEEQEIQEAILSVHHAFMATFSQTSSIKVIENSNGGSWAVNA